LFVSEAQAISTNFRHNHQIRISPIFLIDQDDNKLGSVSLAEAQRRAQEAQMDLVEVAPNARPPVCKIMDYGKWRYQQQKKEHKSSTHKGGRLKMINIDTVRIGEHDLEIKVNKARGFLKEGNKVQFTLRFKGRELAHLNLGRDLFEKVKTALWPVSKVERDGKMEGKRMTLVLQPEHKQPGAKPPTKSVNIPRPTATMGAGATGSPLGIPPRPAGVGAPAGAGGPGGPGSVTGAPTPAAPAAAPVAAPAPIAARGSPAPSIQPPRLTPTPVGAGAPAKS
jgi:translation initiation factor IF-3